MVCKKCGGPMDENQKFCPSCGAAAEQTGGVSLNKTQESGGIDLTKSQGTVGANESPNTQNSYNNQGTYNNQNANNNQGTYNNQYANNNQGTHNNQYANNNQSAYGNQNVNNSQGGYYGGQPPYQNTGYGVTAAMPMKWYKFLIYFSLFAGAVIYVVTAILYITGAIYSVQNLEPESMYLTFSGLRAANIIAGIAFIALAAFSVYTRFMLAGYKKDAPKFLYLNYILGTAVAVIYDIVVIIIISSTMTRFGINANLVDTGSIVGEIISSIILTAVLVSLNFVYFNKRKHLFVN